MSVTTTTAEDVSLQVQRPAPGDTRKPSSEIERGRRTQAATQRGLLGGPPIVLAAFILLGWYVSTASGSVPGFRLPTPADGVSSLFAGLVSGVVRTNALVCVRRVLLDFV